MGSPREIPQSVVIIGSGIFGLSTAYSLAQHESFKNTKITLLDRSEFPAPDGSSIDTSRIIRSDYSDIAYARLGLIAQEKWRKEWWGEDAYQEPGLALISQSTQTEGHGDGTADETYMQRSLTNGKRLGLKVGTRADGSDLEILGSRQAIASIMRQPNDAPGGHADSDYGYVNWRGGWADAEKGCRNARKRLVETGRVDFVTAQVKQLLFTPNDKGHSVRGVVLANGKTLHADLTVLAAGAWTPSLIDLRGIASATGQAIAYMPITTEEQETLQGNPTMLNESTGCFIIPPSQHLLKVGWHSYGYSNPVTIPNPEPQNSSTSEKTMTVSLPHTAWDSPSPSMPQEALDTLRHFLSQTIPCLATRPFTHTRLCWYTDTRTGDWIIDYHPKYEGLFVATGGSGHAYKFLPVVGDRIVDCILGNPPEEFVTRWRFPERAVEDHVWTDDWRGGRKGAVLAEELAKGPFAKL